jgi:hypothetical protein
MHLGSPRSHGDRSACVTLYVLSEISRNNSSARCFAQNEKDHHPPPTDTCRSCRIPKSRSLLHCWDGGLQLYAAFHTNDMGSSRPCTYVGSTHGPPSLECMPAVRSSALSGIFLPALITNIAPGTHQSYFGGLRSGAFSAIFREVGLFK